MSATKSSAQFLFLLFCMGSGLLASSSAYAQSITATLTGNVEDASNAAIPHAQIVIRRLETNTTSQAVSGDDGVFIVGSLEPGTYDVTVSSPGFTTSVNHAVLLAARQQLRLDIDLSVSQQNEVVNVDASTAGAITTDSAAISASLSSRDVLDLPANYRGAGSTSPLNVIQTLPGVQPDSASYPPSPSASPNPGVKFSLQGGLPSQSETTVDGISAQNTTTNNILGDAFPSAESIAEIRVDGVNNNAEYAQPGQITTVTKSGTNTLHGSTFWYFQNSAFDATPYGGIKPKKVANDFGASIGGPVYVPHLYRGLDKTFFFATYEGLRFPQTTPYQALVPTTLMKKGDFSQETSMLYNPFSPVDPATGKHGLYAGSVLPTISPNAAALLSLFPDPNINPAQSVQTSLASPGYNYLSTRRSDISSNQFDARLDQNLFSKLTLFARYTNKSINQVQPGTLALPSGSAFAKYRIFAASATYAITPHLTDEARFGFTLEQDGNASPFNGQALSNGANFDGISKNQPFNTVPYLGFQQLTTVGSRLSSSEQSRIFQYVDNLTLQRGGHTVRLGIDIRRIKALTPLSFAPSDNDANFAFVRGSAFTGEEFADFLVGTPNLSQTDRVTTDNNGGTTAYAVYLQDNWRATPKLNLTFGLRYELHPAFSTNANAIGNFDPSIAKSGRVIFNDGQSAKLDPEELANFNACVTPGVSSPFITGHAANGAPCTPVIPNSQAGLPAGLRTTPKLRFEPRAGFAFRPFGNDRTAIRGGAGYYNITTTGALFYALTGTVSANLQSFYNAETPTGPAFAFPNVSPAGNTFEPALGSVQFYSAVDVNWHDPYSLQTNLSIDHDFGHGFGLRVSYVGLKTWHLVWQPELNQLPASSTTAATDQPRTAFPFPNFFSIPDRSTSAQANYNSGQVELSHRFSKGLSFNSAYTFAKNLSDNQGTYGSFGLASSFVDEQGGYNATDSYHRQADYGNVSGTRRNRFLVSSVYELPYGTGRRFGGGLNRPADLLLGGWQVSGIFLEQSGPFLTPTVPSGTADPSGTGAGTLFGRQQRPDRTGSGRSAHPTRQQWYNTAAFSCPGGLGASGTTGFASLQNKECVVGTGSSGAGIAPIGRFGTSSVGDLNGPAMTTLSTGVSKIFQVSERIHMRAEGSFTNVLNHTNLADPNLDTTSASFGQITQARGSDFGGNRTGQVSVKVEF